MCKIIPNLCDAFCRHQVLLSLIRKKWVLNVSKLWRWPTKCQFTNISNGIEIRIHMNYEIFFRIFEQTVHSCITLSIWHRVDCYPSTREHSFSLAYRNGASSVTYLKIFLLTWMLVCDWDEQRTHFGTICIHIHAFICTSIIHSVQQHKW